MSESAADLANDTILHQTAVEGVIDDVIEEVGGVGHDNEAITNASVAHALNATFSDTEVEAALNALGTKVNLILAALRANGIVLT
jgi:hypothetical protein